eukprot:CAMPEP_0168556076 /NCGR_PEP_ID=MMETSP0413-20121227/8684_1 /TAXON_ID=136452 /ORGANISM="Filamoeba nolandi, Strain NC-AS-23-1" /LENGTH=240 /DNA_ID=CAMNT_0008586987 /DNA_START=19 /DNA_END=741 /DNA_ORIENTATION=-
MASQSTTSDRAERFNRRELVQMVQFQQQQQQLGTTPISKKGGTLVRKWEKKWVPFGHIRVFRWTPVAKDILSRSESVQQLSSLSQPNQRLISDNIPITRSITASFAKTLKRPQEMESNDNSLKKVKKERETISSPPPALSPDEASNDSNALNDFDNDEEKYGVVHNEDSRKSGNDSEEVFDETSNGFQETSNQTGNNGQNVEESSMDGFGNNNTEASNTGADNENSEMFQDTDSKMGYEQ